MEGINKKHQKLDRDTKAVLKRLRKLIKEGWGEKCPDYCWSCSVCEVYRSLEVIEDLSVGAEQNG